MRYSKTLYRTEHKTKTTTKILVSAWVMASCVVYIWLCMINLAEKQALEQVLNHN